MWEADFYTPPVLEVLPFSQFSVGGVKKFRVLRAQDFYTPVALNDKKAAPPSTAGVQERQSPRMGVDASS